jgi:hypothetical protein
MENDMEQITTDESTLKEVLKAALIEILEEKKDVFNELVGEALEDIALANAIKEGEATESVSRAEVFSLLEGK